MDGPRRNAAVAALVGVILVVALVVAFCGGGNDTDEPLVAVTTVETGQPDDGDPDEPDPNGEDPAEADDPTGAGDHPLTEVVVDVHGALVQRFHGGVCYVDGGFLHVAAGYGAFGPERPQVGPYEDGWAFVLTEATEGTREGAHFSIARASEEALAHNEGVRVTLDEGSATGTFEGPTFSGSWSCPAVLTIEQVRDLDADLSR